MVAKKELTREEVSVRIGCSIGTVMKFEREKKLNPRRERAPGAAKDRVWFNPEEVEKVARSYKPTRKQRARVDERLVESNIRGKVAARALPMFKEGRDLADVCAATEADPLLLVQLWETWKLGPEGVIRRREVERQRERDEAIELEERRRQYDKLRRREWMEMQIQIAKLGGKKPPLPKNDGPKNDGGDKEKKTG